MGTPDLTAYSPRLLLHWEEQAGDARHRTIDGTLVFADVSGFTRLSERLARTRGKAGAEELTEIISSLFGELLTVAATRGGEMLKFGGDAVLLFFRGEHHEARAAAGAWEMQRRLRDIGRVETERGPVRLRMSVGTASGPVDLFRVGASHVELIVAGPVTTATVEAESAAAAGEVLLAPSTAAALQGADLGGVRDERRLLRRCPDAPTLPIVTTASSRDASMFVSVGLRGHLLAGDVEPEHRLATVAFIHAVGLDGMLATQPADTVAADLDETVRGIQEACADFGVSFLATDLAADGTKVMAASGAPSAGDEDERRMLLALRRIVTAGTPLAIRAGAHRGHVFAAAVGPPFRRTYTTMGDVTNTAARVMGRAAPGEVLALREVLDACNPSFEAVELEPFLAKGKSEPLVPFRVGDPAATAAPPAARSLPLVGRDEEVAAFLSGAAQAVAGTGVLVEVVGDMGSGKTRLVDEVLTAADIGRVVVHCEPYHRETPFHPIRHLLEEATALDRSDGAASLTDLVSRVAPDLEPWLPLIGSVLDIDLPETEATRHLEPRFRRTRTASAVVGLLRATLGSTAIVIEDTHWMDEASSSVLGEIEAVVDGTSWLVVLTRRDEPSTFTPSRPGSETLRLAPLSEPAMEELIRHASEGRMAPHVRRALMERAAGNPLYLTELLNTGAEGEVSETLESIIAAQIDKLPPADRRLLRHAAVLGSHFDCGLLATIAEEPAIKSAGARSLTARLQWLCIPEGRGRLRFRHQLICDVAYGSLPFRQRRELHSRAAGALEASSPTEHAGLLSLHYERANRHEACWLSARLAAKRACDKYANVEAVELFERALRAARHLPYLSDRELAETWDELGRRHSLLGSLGPARAAYQRARRHARNDPAAYAGLCLREARAAEREANTTTMDRWIRRGLHAVEAVEGEDAGAMRAELLVLGAWAKLTRGRIRQASQWAELALASGETSGNKRAVAYAYSVLDNVDAALGRPPDPSRAARALEIFRETGDLPSEAVLLNNLGMDAYYRGRWIEAVRLFDGSRAAMAKVGNVIDAGYGALNIAEILVEQGHLDQAETALAELEPLWQSLDHALGLAYVDNHRGRIRLHRGDAEGAIELLTQAREVFERNQLVIDALDAEARTAECLLRLGRVDEARARLDEAHRRDRGSGGTRVAARLQRVLAYVALAENDPETAWSAMDESLATAQRLSSPYDVALALEGFDVLAARDGRTMPDDSVDRLELLDELGVVATPGPPLPTALVAV